MFLDIASDIIKTVVLTVVWDKGLRAFGKKDYGEIIKLSGISVCGMDVIKLMNYWRKNPPAVVRTVKGVGAFFEKLDNGTGKVLEGIEKFNNGIKFLLDKGFVK